MNKYLNYILLLYLMIFTIKVKGQSHNDIDSLMSEGKYFEAITVINHTIESNTSTHIDYITLLNKLSLCYNFTENYAKAIETGVECATLTQTEYGRYSEEYATVIGNLGFFHGCLGHIDKAIEYLKDSSHINETIFGNTSHKYASSISNLAFYLSENGDFEDANLLIEKANRIFQQNGIIDGNEYYSLIESNIKTAYNCENYQKGIDISHSFFKSASKLYKISPTRFANILLYISKCYSALGDIKNAIIYNLKAIEISKQEPTFRLISKIELLDHLSYNYLEEGSDSLYIQTILEEHKILKEVLETQLHTLTSKDQIEYSNASFRFYHQLSNDIVYINEIAPNRVKNLISLKEIIYEGAILLKGLILNTYKNVKIVDNYHISMQAIKEKLSDNDIAIEFIDFIDETNREGENVYAAIAIRKKWNEPIFVTPLQYESLLNYGLYKLEEKDSLTLNLHRLYNHTWKRLSHIIKPGDNIYFSASGILNKLPLENLIIKDEKIMSDVYNMHRLSSTRELAIKKEAIKYKKAALYGGLNYDMTNEAMLTENAKYQTDSTYTLFASRGLIEDSIRGYKWTNLNNTKMEVEFISEQMQQNGISTKVFQGNEGSEESFKALSGKGYNIIHIATHGFFFPDPEAKRKDYFQPIMLSDDLGKNYAPADLSLWRTGLVLSGGNRAWQGDSIPDHVEDGILTANEIKDLDLRGADLVVLSACNTGQGEITSEGVFGLQRAFKMAGAQTIIMSLTEVDDQTTMAMMNKLYSNLMEGQSKHDAFYNAQRYIRSIKPDPKYWRGWIMLD